MANDIIKVWIDCGVGVKHTRYVFMLPRACLSFLEQQHSYPIARGYSFIRIAVIIIETFVITAILMLIHNNRSIEKIKARATPDSENK